MAYNYSFGRNLATIDPTTGQPGAVTGVGEQRGDTLLKTVTIRAPLAVLESRVPSKGAGHDVCGWVPSGYYVDHASLASADGEGTITISCINPGQADGAGDIAPVQIQYQIVMSEVQLDLIAHPHVQSKPGAADMILKWLATDVAQRVDGDKYYWVDTDGSRQEITGQAADYCDAWMAGIKTYNVYYPIIDKQSVYTRVPGLALGGVAGASAMSVTGGTAKFSAGMGKFSAPDISLEGYAQTGWFKSGDEYRSSGRAYIRSEQWTWTPYGKGSQFEWIYKSGEES